MSYAELGGRFKIFWYFLAKVGDDFRFFDAFWWRWVVVLHLPIFLTVVVGVNQFVCQLVKKTLKIVNILSNLILNQNRNNSRMKTQGNLKVFQFWYPLKHTNLLISQNNGDKIKAGKLAYKTDVKKGPEFGPWNLVMGDIKIWKLGRYLFSSQTEQTTMIQAIFSSG